MQLVHENNKSWLYLERYVRFGEVDLAGVIHFQNIFRWCHESWEQSMQLYGLSVENIFPSAYNQKERTEILLPIVHCQANFFLPIKIGDFLEVILTPKKIDSSSFQIETMFRCKGNNVAKGVIKHIAINEESRQRCPLPHSLGLWLESST